MHGASVASTARRARVGSARAGPRPQRERAQRRASALHAQARPRAVRGRAGTWEHRLAPKERRLLARAVPFHSAWNECRQRGAARARRKRTCWASSPERASAGERKRATRASHLRAVRGRAGTWEHGLAPKERRLLARAVPFHGAWSKCRQRGAARARRKRPCWASSPGDERAQESASALHAQATTRNEREGWHVGAGAWRRRNGGLSLVQCPSIAYGPSVASAARRARGGSARAGPRPQRERASAGERKRATRASHHAQ